MRHFLLQSALLCAAFCGFAQSSTDTLHSRKGRFYLLWGYNRDWYARSNIHFKNNGDPGELNNFGVYDFTLYHLRAHDRPDFDKLGDVINFTIPQYNFRIGYALNEWSGFELNYDHAKYIVDDGQVAHIKGSIFGQQMDKDTLLDQPYFHFEHSDGANFWMISYVRKRKLVVNGCKKCDLSLFVKSGMGPVIPRTDVTIFSNRINNRFHVAGMCAGLEGGLHAEFFKHLTLEFSGKGVVADYMDCLVQGHGHGQASHFLEAFEAVLVAGYTF